MKISKYALVNGKTNSKPVTGFAQYPDAVAAAGYIPNGFDNSTRHTIAERQEMGCRQVVVIPSLSGEAWVCIDVVSGTKKVYPKDVDPCWAGEMAAAEFAGEHK